MQNGRGFASDNHAGFHPAMLEALQSVNEGHVHAYGDDPYTAEAVAKFRELFGEGVDVYFVFSGTGANIVGLKNITDRFNSVICAKNSHLYVDECNAPEIFTGCKLITLSTPDGKLTVDLVDKVIRSRGDEHQAVPKAVSVAQATELGTVYSVQELKELADFVHKHSCLLHVDGARISNAAAYLGKEFREFTTDAGVDVLSFGGTKNGLIAGEAVIFFKKGLSQHFKFIRKQATQLASKMRFVSAQFLALLKDNLWHKNASQANKMARLLYEQIRDIAGIKITQKVESNAVFAIVPREKIPELLKKYFFYVWDDKTSEVRWMTSFDTTEEDVHEFATYLKKVLS